MLRDAPTTFAPVSRNRRVMKDPRPPFAPVMKITLSFMNGKPLDLVSQINQAAVGRVHLICALRDKKLLMPSTSISAHANVPSSNFPAPSSRLPTRKPRLRVIVEPSTAFVRQRRFRTHYPGDPAC